MHARIPVHLSIANKHSLQMDLQAELAARLGVTPAAPVTTTTGEGSEFENSIAPSESVTTIPGEKYARKRERRKRSIKIKD